jgi:hypothetical protein
MMKRKQTKKLRSWEITSRLSLHCPSTEPLIERSMKPNCAHIIECGASVTADKMAMTSSVSF